MIIALIVCAFQREPQIRVEVEAVNVLATVTDKKGRFVIDLPQNRFQVYEEGIQQTISNFNYQTNLPLLIALLIDTSSSVRLKLDFEKTAATHFVYSVMRPRDQALLVEFDHGVSLLHDFTDRPGAIAKEIQTIRAGGGTALLDAIYVVCREKLTDRSARRTMVVVSDGVDRNSEHSPEEILEMAHRSGVIIYAIGTTRFSADQEHKGEKMLEELATESGGQAFFPYSAERLGAAFEQISEELRSQYSLTYIPTDTAKDGRFRKIKVKIIKDRGLDIRHRAGYYAPTG